MDKSLSLEDLQNTVRSIKQKYQPRSARSAVGPSNTQLNFSESCAPGPGAYRSEDYGSIWARAARRPVSSRTYEPKLQLIDDEPGPATFSPRE